FLREERLGVGLCAQRLVLPGQFPVVSGTEEQRQRRDRRIVRVQRRQTARSDRQRIRQRLGCACSRLDEPVFGTAGGDSRYGGEVFSLPPFSLCAWHGFPLSHACAFSSPGLSRSALLGLECWASMIGVLPM